MSGTGTNDRVIKTNRRAWETANRMPTTLKALWVVWLVLLAGGLVVQQTEIAGRSNWATFGRLGSSVVLVIAAWLWHASYRGSSASWYTLMIAIGIVLGTIGDFFNAGVLQSFIELPNPVLGGIAAFGLGHIAYIAGCWDVIRKANLTSIAKMWIAILAWQVIAVIGWLLIVLPSEVEEAKIAIWPALPYSMLLAGTAGVATGMVLQDRRFTILAVGAALFLFSDLVLAWGMFQGSIAYQTAAVWIPYGGGQMLIVYAITTAGRAILEQTNEYSDV